MRPNKQTLNSERIEREETGSPEINIPEIVSSIQSFRVGMGFYILMDFSGSKYLCVSPSVKSITGYTADCMMKGGAEFITRLYHPDEKICQKYVHERISSFYHSLVPSERLKYRYSFPLHLQRSDGRYICLLCQLIFLSAEGNSQPSHGLLFCTDITVFKGEEFIILTITKYEESGVFTDNVYHYKLENKLSKREAEINQLVAQGFQSKEIARKLNVSKYTVESHRRNIRKKLRN